MKIAFDVDGVILNFYHKALPNKNNFVQFWDCPELGKIWHQIKDDRDLWCNLESMLDFKKINFDFDIYLTAIDPNFIECRQLNLLKVGWPKKEVVASDRKIEYCIDNKIDILIDDKPSTIQQCIDNDIKCIQFYPSFAAWEKIPNAYIAYNEDDINYYINKIKNEQ